MAVFTMSWGFTKALLTVAAVLLLMLAGLAILAAPWILVLDVDWFHQFGLLAVVAAFAVNVGTCLAADRAYEAFAN